MAHWHIAKERADDRATIDIESASSYGSVDAALDELRHRRDQVGLVVSECGLTHRHVYDAAQRRMVIR